MTTVAAPLPRHGDEPPVTGAVLDTWTAGLPPELAGVAVVAAGLDAQSWRAFRGEPQLVPYLNWWLDRGRLSRDPDELVHELDAHWLAEPRPDLPGPHRPFLRLAVSGNIVPADVVPRLLRAPGVAAAVLPAVRPPGALRRRPWRWPLRLGLLGGSVAVAHVADNLRMRGGMPPTFFDVRDVRVEPAAVDVLVVPGGLDEAVDALRATRQVANAVVVLDQARTAWPIVEAQLALARAVSAAVVTVVGPPPDGPPAAQIGAVLHRLLLDMSHAYPFDVAVTAALGRQALVVGELDSLAGLDLPHLARDLAADLRRTAARARAHPPTTEPPEVSWGLERLEPRAGSVDEAVDRLEQLAGGAFLGESHEAAGIGHALEQADAALDEATEPRLLQCYVGTDNVLSHGLNTVDVFIGPEEAESLSAGRVSDALLGFDEPDVVSVRVTVVLVPLVPAGEAQRAELDVPRVGRSPNARLVLDVASTAIDVSARLMVLHRNRVLQTALLNGTVGQPAQLREVAVVRPDLAHLDDRRAFDLALVLNHDDTGKPAAVAHRDGMTAVDALPELTAITDRMRHILVQAAFLRGRSGKPPAEAARKLLVDLAVEGNDLYTHLEGHLLPFKDIKRVQVVTARSGWFLPIELAYGRVAPDDDAKLCASWQAGGQACGPTCGTGADDTRIVCPAAFWGLSHVIERHYVDASEGGIGPQYLTVVAPTAKRRRLTATHATVAASGKVVAKDVTATLACLGPDTRRATTWEEWAAALQATPTDVLVLMPHTDVPAATLEISRQTLRRGRIEDRHVTGGHDVRPIVVLFGCDTAGSADDPAGFATRFMARKAGVVFTSLTMLLNAHAAALAQRLTGLLRDPDRAEQPLGELVTAFRRQAVRDGLLAGLAVTAYGDADWTA